jgi:hypothetical protein
MTIELEEKLQLYFLNSCVYALTYLIYCIRINLKSPFITHRNFIFTQYSRGQLIILEVIDFMKSKAFLIITLLSITVSIFFNPIKDILKDTFLIVSSALINIYLLSFLRHYIVADGNKLKIVRLFFNLFSIIVFTILITERLKIKIIQNIVLIVANIWVLPSIFRNIYPNVLFDFFLITFCLLVFLFIKITYKILRYDSLFNK